MRKWIVSLFLVLFSPFAFSAVSCERFSDEDIGEVVDYSCHKHIRVCAQVIYIGNNNCLVLAIPEEAMSLSLEEEFGFKSHYHKGDKTTLARYPHISKDPPPAQ